MRGLPTGFFALPLLVVAILFIPRHADAEVSPLCCFIWMLRRYTFSGSNHSMLLADIVSSYIYLAIDLYFYAAVQLAHPVNYHLAILLWYFHSADKIIKPKNLSSIFFGFWRKSILFFLLLSFYVFEHLYLHQSFLCLFFTFVCTQISPCMVFHGPSFVCANYHIRLWRYYSIWKII